MKIGIVTHYYKSKNYGGNLQAYALCEFLNKRYDAEQLCLQHIRKRRTKKSPISFIKKGVTKCVKILQNLINRKKIKRMQQLLNDRNNRFEEFNKSIKHSKAVYNEDTIRQAVLEYDFFITGSDQVWHPAAVNGAYLLSFVKGKPKISYAASLSVDRLSVEQQNMFETALKDYTAISVREESAIELLKPIVDKPISWVLDPVFLLEREDWESFSSDIKIDGKYLLCYFLGDDKEIRALAEEYAKKHELKLVNIAYASGNYNKADKTFGDVKVLNASPVDFVALIKDADMIFTDSFHAVAFSLIFDKNYFVFNRFGFNSMSSRISSLSKLYQTENRFCSTEERRTLNYIESVKQPKGGFYNEQIKTKKEESIKFLEGLLG